jgi:hypothetical protein
VLAVMWHTCLRTIDHVNVLVIFESRLSARTRSVQSPVSCDCTTHRVLILGTTYSVKIRIVHNVLCVALFNQSLYKFHTLRCVLYGNCNGCVRVAQCSATPYTIVCSYCASIDVHDRGRRVLLAWHAVNSCTYASRRSLRLVPAAQSTCTRLCVHVSAHSHLKCRCMYCSGCVLCMHVPTSVHTVLMSIASVPALGRAMGVMLHTAVESPTNTTCRNRSRTNNRPHGKNSCTHSIICAHMNACARRCAPGFAIATA